MEQLHVYERHYGVAAKVVTNFSGVTCYDFGVPRTSFQTPWEAFDANLKDWFTLEQELRRSPDLATSTRRVLADPLLNGALQMIRIYHGAERGWDADRLREELAALPETDLTAAAYEFIGRRHPDVLNAIPHPTIFAFFEAYRGAREGEAVTLKRLWIKTQIKTLHRSKNSAYGDAWRRRGELTSVLANIARKVDRLEHFITEKTVLADESIFDTAIDLLVYVTKYRLFLMDLAPETAEQSLVPGASTPLCDHVSNFDMLIDRLEVPNVCRESRGSIVRQVVATFDELHSEASTAASMPGARLQLATRLSDLTLLVLVAMLCAQPDEL